MTRFAGRGERHDVVIVGGGAAGCVVASRLSEESGRLVLLLEAGPAYAADGVHPAALRDERLLPDDHLWRYEGFHDAGSAATETVRGRVLGGSGAVNALVYQRGLPEDYDGWGQPGWRADELEPWFRRVEGVGARPGADGMLAIARTAPAQWTEPHRGVHDAARELGAPEHPDLLYAEHQGVGAYARNAAAGVRVNAALAYLLPARRRPGLTVRGGATVTRVLVQHGRAIGVEASVDGKLERILAGEVILSAGAIETPQLLALSGIGAAAELESHGIRPVADHPGVGAGLSDHPSVVLSMALRREQPWDLRCLIGQVWTSDLAARLGARSDLQLMAMSGPSAGADVHGAAQPAAELTLSALLYAPRSSGRVALRGAAGQRPHVHYGYLQDAEDRARLREAVRYAMTLIEHPRVSGVIADRRGLPDGATLRDDAQLDAWMRGALRTAHHGCGTCRMGSPDDALAVVDAQGRVFGIDRLRIADLSIVPRAPAAPTHATALVVGERIAGWC